MILPFHLLYGAGDGLHRYVPLTVLANAIILSGVTEDYTVE